MLNRRLQAREGILLNDPNRAGGLTANAPHFMLLCNITVAEISLSGVVLFSSNTSCMTSCQVY